jgi:hypothetical protein
MITPMCQVITNERIPLRVRIDRNRVTTERYLKAIGVICKDIVLQFWAKREDAIGYRT